MRAKGIETEPVPFEPNGSTSASSEETRSASGTARLQRWWRRQAILLVEDAAIDGGPMGARANRLAIPMLVSPVLLVPVLILFQEPANRVATLALQLGLVAIGYELVADWVGKRIGHPLWIQILSDAVYAVIISTLLWCFLTFDHPRPHTHVFIFFLYFLMIGAAGLTDDPRQPVCAGVFSIVSYLVTVTLFQRAVAAGSSPMALQLAPQFEWVANTATVGLLGAATYTAASSSWRGRAVRRMSVRDGLTGLLNRRAFDQCLEHLARRADHKQSRLTIAMIDLDHFKRLNDAHGHVAGDAVLRWVASCMRRSFRSTDVVSRYGGEEFVVAFVDSDNLSVLSSRLEALRSAIEKTPLHWIDPEGRIRVTVSIGMARLPDDGTTVNEVLTAADRRMYEAKYTGRNRIVTGHNAVA